MDKVILHCDLNNFFASVECKKFPQLAGYPVAVCGNVEDRHGIILAKNDTAKKFGVKTAEVVWEAKRKCPDLVLLPPHMDEYVSASKQVRTIYSDYTDLIEPFGIDECWLDVTGSQLLFGSGEKIANTIRERVKSELGLTISVGVSFNKIFAKLGSDLKKPDAVTCITKDGFKKTVWQINASELLGVGKATLRQFDKYGISTIGDIARCEKSFLIEICGKNGELLWNCANGEGDDKVANQDTVTTPKSIGNSTTCNKDLSTPDEVWTVIYSLCESVSNSLRRHELTACGVQISIKDNTLATKEWQSPLPFQTRNSKELAIHSMNLFKKNYSWSKPIRAIGVRAINLSSDIQLMQCNLLYDVKKGNEIENLEDKIFSLRNRYGESSIIRASLMDSKKASKKDKTSD